MMQQGMLDTLEHRRSPLVPAIAVRSVSKTYPGVNALRKVDFDLAAGEVHGLVGANGAGKSTFIRVLTGAETPDDGEIEIEGVSISRVGPSMQYSNAIAAIYQELTIVPHMSAQSNVFLGNVPRIGWLSDRKRMRREFSELSTRMGVEIDPEVDAGKLSVANQQMIEVMRAVAARRNIIIMDEPTAPLGPTERNQLYELIKRLKESGTSIIFISHDLDEVLRLCDRVSVMREGQLIETRQSLAWSKPILVKAMLGDIELATKSVRDKVRGEVVLAVDSLAVPGRLMPITFTAYRGEVLGIAGLVGSGRSELLRAIAGAEPTASGSLSLNGVITAMPSTVRRALRVGIALAPEDRKQQGLVLLRSALTNLLLANMRSVARFGVFDPSARRAAGEQLAERLGFPKKRLAFDALHLSGGNQQKLILGKCLHRKPDLLLLDEPTRGIDLGAKQEIFETIHRFTQDGMTVILVSSDLEEVVEHSDRILVLAQGRNVGLLERSEASLKKILSLIFTAEDHGSVRTMQ
jgi:ABC-type sugar transport system ATPase subunit